MKKRTELEIAGEELIRRMERYAKHVTGEKPLTLRTTRLALPPAEKPLKPRRVGTRKQPQANGIQAN